MAQTPEIASFWTGSPLSFFEILCIRSFLDAGYRFHLYTLGDVGRLPDGVIHHDATEIFDGELGHSEDVRFNAAVYSDVFRALLMRKTDFLWVDLDVYCARPLDRTGPHMFGVIRRKNSVNNCVLRLPKTSPALQLMLNFYFADVPIPVWWRPERLNRLFAEIEAGRVPSLSSLPWTTTGPGVLGWALRLTGEIGKGQHWHTYYQYEKALDQEFLTQGTPVEDYEFPAVRFVHLYGSTKIHLRDMFGGMPPEGSYIDVICKRHGIDPAAAPIASFSAAAQPQPAEVG